MDLETALEGEFGFLAGLGYDGPQFETVRDPLLGKTLRATYVASELSREIQLLSVTRDQRAGRNLTTLHIYRLPERELEDELSVNTFIAKERPDLDLELARLRDSVIDRVQFLTAALRIYRDVLERDLRDVIRGTSWDGRFFVSWT